MKYFRAKLEIIGPPISGHVADFTRGKSELGLAARSRTVAGGCSGGRAARALVDSAADTAAATDKSCSGSAVPSGDAIEPRIRRHYLTSSKGLLEADMAAATENEKSGCEQPNNSAVRTLSTRLSAHPAVDPLLADRQRASVLIRDDAFLRPAARLGFARSLPAHFGSREKYCVPPCGCWLRLSDKPRVEDHICHRRNIARGARNPTAPWRVVHSDNWQSIANTSLAWISAPQLLSDYSELAGDGIRRNKGLDIRPCARECVRRRQPPDRRASFRQDNDHSFRNLARAKHQPDATPRRLETRRRRQR